MTDSVRHDLQLSALVADGNQPAATSGVIARGQAFLQVGVRHGLTGVLTSEVAAKGWFAGGKHLEAGTPVYGVPMGGPDGPGVVWCAPRSEPAAHGPPHWRAICLPYGDSSHIWVEARPALAPIGLSWDDDTARKADTPQVSRQPVNFPAMTLSYAFAGWNEHGWILVDTRIDWGEGPQLLRSIALPPGPDGALDLKLLGGEIALRPSPHSDAKAPEQAVAEVRTPPKPGATVVY